MMNFNTAKRKTNGRIKTEKQSKPKRSTDAIKSLPDPYFTGKFRGLVEEQ